MNDYLTIFMVLTASVILPATLPAPVPPGHGVTVEGEITGDSVLPNWLGPDDTVLIENSPGGVVRNALAMAEIIHDSGARVEVTGGCDSACVLLYAAAPSGKRSSDVELCAHSPFDIDTGKEDDRASEVMAEALNRYNTPLPVVGAVLFTPHIGPMKCFEPW